MKENLTINKGDFLYCVSPTSRWVCIVNEIRGEEVHYFASYNLKAKVFSTDDWFRIEYVSRIASVIEREKLMKAIDINELDWDSMNYLLFEKPDKMIVPDSINIFKLSVTERSGYGDGLFIGSESGNKLLFTNELGSAIINNYENLFEKVRCRIVPCEYSELKCGDTAYRKYRGTDPYDLSMYVKMRKKGYSILYDNTAVDSYDKSCKWYKVVPI